MTPKSPHKRHPNFIKLRRERAAAAARQAEGFESAELFKLTVESKLLTAARDLKPEIKSEKWFSNFMRCGHESGFVLCASCGDGRKAPYRCSQKWCPACNWRISLRRKVLMEKITEGIPQLKHVVLTQRNFDHLTREKILESRQNLFALRRQKILAKKAHGCASCEITNESRGWHLHWHLLVTQRWIDAASLSIAWGKLVGQEFAIVKVQSVDGKAYLQELCKYVVKGSEFAKWSPAQILEFIEAQRNIRMFSTFGKFREIAKHARAVLATERQPCGCKACGSVDLIFGQDEAHCGRLLEKNYA